MEFPKGDESENVQFKDDPIQLRNKVSSYIYKQKVRFPQTKSQLGSNIDSVDQEAAQLSSVVALEGLTKPYILRRVHFDDDNKDSLILIKDNIETIKNYG